MKMFSNHSDRFSDKTPYKLPKVFDIKEIKRLFGVIDQPLFIVALSVGFFCGLRISEVCKLKVEDVDLFKRTLFIRDSKNPNRGRQGYGKDRYVAIPQPLVPILDKWLRYIENREYLFPMYSRKDQPFNTSIMRKNFKRYLRKAGLHIVAGADSKGRPMHKYRFHTLRHTYATYLYNKGVDLAIIGKLLGHSDTRSTQIYTHIGVEKEKKELDNVFK